MESDEEVNPILGSSFEREPKGKNFLDPMIDIILKHLDSRKRAYLLFGKVDSDSISSNPYSKLSPINFKDFFIEKS